MAEIKTIKLPEVLDAAAMGDVYKLLKKSLGTKKKDLSIDLSNVTHIGTLGLQLLASVQKTCNKRGGKLTIVACSDCVNDALKTLAMESCFEL